MSFAPKTFSGKVLHGVAWVSLGATSVKIIGFITSFILLSVFTLHEYGTYQLVLSVAGLFILLSIQGIDDTVIAAGTRAIGAKDVRKSEHIGRGYFLFRLFAGVSIWALIFFGSSFFAQWYSRDILELLKQYSWAFLILPFERIISYDLTCKRRFRALSLVSFTQEFIKLLIIIVSLFVLHLGIKGALLAIPIAHGISTLIFLCIIEKKYFYGFTRTAIFRFKEVLLQQGIWDIGSRFARQGEKNLRPMFIQFFLGREAVALFSMAEKVYGYVAGFFPIDSVLMPTIAAEVHDRERLQRVLEKGIKYTVPFYIIVSIVFFFTFPLLIQYIFPLYKPAIPLLYILILYIPFVGIAHLMTSFFVSHQEQKAMFGLIIFRSIIFVFIAPICLLAFGARGAILEFVLTLGLFNILRYMWLLRKYPELRVKLSRLFVYDNYDRAVLTRLREKFYSFSRT